MRTLIIFLSIATFIIGIFLGKKYFDHTHPPKSAWTAHDTEPPSFPYGCEDCTYVIPKEFLPDFASSTNGEHRFTNKTGSLTHYPEPKVKQRWWHVVSNSVVETTNSMHGLDSREFHGAERAQ